MILRVLIPADGTQMSLVEISAYRSFRSCFYFDLKAGRHLESW
jgi:hypothetical protein